MIVCEIMGVGRGGAFAPPGFWKSMYFNYFAPPWLCQGGAKIFFYEKIEKNKSFWVKIWEKVGQKCNKNLKFDNFLPLPPLEILLPPPGKNPGDAHAC